MTLYCELVEVYWLLLIFTNGGEEKWAKVCVCGIETKVASTKRVFLLYPSTLQKSISQIVPISLVYKYILLNGAKEGLEIATVTTEEVESFRNV